MYSQNIYDQLKVLSDTLRVQIQTQKLENAKKTVFKIDAVSRNSKEDSILGYVNKLKGNYFYRISDYENAMKYWLEASRQYENSNDSLETSKIYNNISLILNSSGEYRESLVLKKKALTYCPVSVNKTWNLSLLQNIGSTYLYLKKHDSSMYYLKKSYQIARELNSNRHLGQFHHNSSINYLNMGDYHKTIAHTDTVQKVYKEFVSRPALENSIFYSAKALFKLKMYNEALQKAEESLTMVLESGMSINAAENYGLLSSIYEKLDRDKLALDALKKSNTFRDSIYTIDKNKIVLELEKKYETEKKEKENLQLKQETAHKDLTIAKKNNIILITSLIFGLIIILLILYQLKKFKSKNQALQESIQIREKFEKELEVVRDNIAKDFHDDLGNKLARIATLSDLMISTSDNRDKENIIKALKSIKMDSDVLYKGTRDFMFSLKANSDYIEELFTYLSDFGEEFFESFNIDFFVEKHIEENIKLPYYWTRQIIMIFKEAMTNVVKHSKASMATLTIKQDDENLFLSLSDNGSGFNQKEIERKNGLANIESRAHKIKANIEIITGNQGTTISFHAELSNLSSHGKTSA
ncbi:tetratricopeptide repeat-containing sensor histidine kinase [Aquimarina rubra]|uniref:histidine kinase n=1 Tax=Aquimarina rubra TaxID=1920033 RepID=A0ABW5LH54_9FLAO